MFRCFVGVCGYAASYKNTGMRLVHRKCWMICYNHWSELRIVFKKISNKNIRQLISYMFWSWFTFSINSGGIPIPEANRTCETSTEPRELPEANVWRDRQKGPRCWVKLLGKNVGETISQTINPSKKPWPKPLNGNNLSLVSILTCSTVRSSKRSGTSSPCRSRV